jgi:hypothetical protein
MFLLVAICGRINVVRDELRVRKKCLDLEERFIKEKKGWRRPYLLVYTVRSGR